MRYGNHVKSVVLLAFMAALFIGAGHLLGGQQGMVMGLAMAGLMNIGMWWFSDKIVLRMHRAKPVTAESSPALHGMVRELAGVYGLPMPALYIIEDPTPNAFATGRSPSHSAVAVTTGILELLDRRELRGVLAHELGHIKNRDTLVSTLAATMAGALSMLAEMAMWRSVFGGSRDDDHAPHPAVALLGLVLAPIAALVIQGAISRSREFLADETGALSSGDALALASALEKIEAYVRQVPVETGVPAAAHLYIVNPFRAQALQRLFSTHPPTRERVRRLEKLANERIGIQI